jgi:hypothetical protein
VRQARRALADRPEVKNVRSKPSTAWSDDFDLQQRFQDLAGEFASFGFQDVGEDTDLMLRCAAAVLKADPSPCCPWRRSKAKTARESDRWNQQARIRQELDVPDAEIGTHEIDGAPNRVRDHVERGSDVGSVHVDERRLKNVELNAHAVDPFEDDRHAVAFSRESRRLTEQRNEEMAEVQQRFVESLRRLTPRSISRWPYSSKA